MISQRHIESKINKAK